MQKQLSKVCGKRSNDLKTWSRAFAITLGIFLSLLVVVQWMPASERSGIFRSIDRRIQGKRLERTKIGSFASGASTTTETTLSASPRQNQSKEPYSITSTLLPASLLSGNRTKSGPTETANEALWIRLPMEFNVDRPLQRIPVNNEAGCTIGFLHWQKLPNPICNQKSQ